MAVTAGNGTITGLAPATITYVANDVNQVQVLGGNGSNKYTISNTVSNSSNPTTFIRGGTGNDTFNLLGSTGTLQIDGGGGSDVVNVGGTPTGAANVKGTLGLGDTGGKIRLEVFDGGDTASDTVQVTDHSVLGLAGQIFFNPTQLTSATLRLDGAPDNVFVSSTPAGVPITIVDGGNIDIIHVGSAANTLDGIQGPLTVNGSISGFNTLIINDQGSTTPHVYTQTATTLSRSGAATISFFNVENLAVNKGPVSGTPPAAADLALTSPVAAGQTATLTGRLVSSDAGGTLSLTVDWGDGSAPDHATPGTAPFALSHRYAAPGRFTARAVWADAAGQSNSQDLPVTVTGSASQRFVAQAYRDLLGREADPAGLAALSAFLDQGGGRAQAAGVITANPEYHARVARGVYQAYLGRDADPASLQAAVAGSAEYLQLHGGTSDGFLAGLYQDALGRPIDAASLAAGGQALAAGASRGQVAALVFASAEYRSRLVQGLYQQFLHRAADAGGLAAAVQALGQGARDEAVVAALVGSAEYSAQL
jgi:hypothetical protein